jgi:hypothetical protein
MFPFDVFKFTSCKKSLWEFGGIFGAFQSNVSNVSNKKLTQPKWSFT